MVLEYLINPKKAEDRPLIVFLVSIVYTLVAVFFAYFLFPSQASILSVAFITILFVPFFQKLFELEEEKEDDAAKTLKKRNVLERHTQPILVYTAFFLGVIVATSFVSVFFQSQNLFSLQADVIKNFGTASAIQEGDFNQIFINNTQVLLLTFVLSILFGAGAIFILAWNASVIAVYAALVAKSFSPPAAAYLFGVPLGLWSIAVHGVPEVLAYFVAGLAGGILSVGIIREKIGSKNFHLILKDSVKFLVFSEILIVLAALIEAA